MFVFRSYTSSCRCSGDIIVSFGDDVLGVLLGGAVPKIVLIVLLTCVQGVVSEKVRGR